MSRPRSIPPDLSQVSKNAVIVYLYALSESDALGRCAGIYAVAAWAGLGASAVRAAINELEKAGFAECVWTEKPGAILKGGGVVMEDVADLIIKGHSAPFLCERLSADQWRELRSFVFERDDYICRYCGQRGGKLECDHIEPLSKGGTNEPGNLVTACQECNRAKRDKLLEKWQRHAST